MLIKNGFYAFLLTIILSCSETVSLVTLTTSQTHYSHGKPIQLNWSSFSPSFDDCLIVTFKKAPITKVVVEKRVPKGTNGKINIPLGYRVTKKPYVIRYFKHCILDKEHLLRESGSFIYYK